MKTAGPCETALNDAGLRSNEIDEIVLVGGQTKMPLVREVVKRIFRKEPFSGVNPDEAVASGAAKQASVLKGDIRDILLLDVTAFSLGIKTEGGIFSKIVEKNSSIPLRKTEVYTTTQENQSFVRIEVFQGEKPMASDNKMIGTFDLVGIPPGPKGSAKIDVIFDIDANGIIRVSAKDQSTGKEQAIKITADSGLSKAELENKTKEIGAEFAKKYQEAKKFRPNRITKKCRRRKAKAAALRPRPKKKAKQKRKNPFLTYSRKKRGKS